MNTSILAITLGDVAGIGPEIIAKALLCHPGLRKVARPVVIGDHDAMLKGIRAAGLDEHALTVIDEPELAVNDPGIIELIQDGPSLGTVEYGNLDAKAGDGAYRFVVRACDYAKQGRVDGIVTSPLNKAAMHAAGHDFPGHTELLAREFGVSEFNLVLSADDLYVFHLTTHMALRDAIDAITPQRVRHVISLASAFAEALGRPNEPIGLAGLNPHAGENGIFGTEDAEILAPAVQEARIAGIPVDGPIPADALFPAAIRRGRWRIVIACYHDQGHAPFKSVFGNDGVNITVGLPTVRVSVDHGTAFDIAGEGIADESSLVLAYERAAQLAPNWAKAFGSQNE